MSIITLTKDQLQQMLEECAERGAARAIKAFRAQEAGREWITKEDACQMLHCSYSTLNNLVNQGKIHKNSEAKRGRKFYSRKDIENYVAGCG